MSKLPQNEHRGDIEGIWGACKSNALSVKKSCNCELMSLFLRTKSTAFERETKGE